MPSRVAKIQTFLMSNRGLYLKKIGKILEAEEKSLENENKCDIITLSDNVNQMKYENLNIIFTIFKNIFFIADKEFIEMLISEDLYMITFGALECTYI